MVRIGDLEVRPSQMADRCAALDWAATPLGPVASWPAELRVAVQMCLDASFPMTVGWGEELSLIYNDGYIPIMGAKHPAGLGRPALEVYGELADFIEPITRAAMERGEVYTGTDMALPMYRHDRLEEGYFDVWYGPIRDAVGVVRGVMASTRETTATVLSERRQRTVFSLAECFIETTAQEPLLPKVLAVLAGNTDDVARLALFEIRAGNTLEESVSSPQDYLPGLLAEGVLDRAAAWLQQRPSLSSKVERLDARRFLVTLVNPELTGATGHLAIVEPGPMVTVDSAYQQFLDVSREVIVGALYRLRSERLAMDEMRRQLDDRDRLYRMLFEHTAEGVAIADPDGRISAANPAACRLLGYTEAEVLELGYAGTVANADGSLTRALEELAGSGRFDGELRLIARDGREVRTDVSSVRIRDDASGNERIITLLRDAAPRLVTQDRISTTARLEALGQLTGGISHDFNNLLNVIINGAEELTECLPEQDPGRESADLVLSASLRAAELTRQLLAFSQQRPSQPQRLATTAALDELRQLLTRVLGSSIRVEVLPGENAEIEADPALLSSSLLNLCINARDAMPDGGTIGIVSGREVLTAERAASLDVRAGDYAFMTITDTGTGIPRELLERVIEPYFTTKPSGQGTGLGLAMVYGFVRQCGGAVEIESEVGRGTRITLRFPVLASSELPALAATPSSAPNASGSGQHILVVEDNDLLARMLCNILRKAGYRVTHSGHAGEALDLMANDASVDVVITDILLGEGLNGWDLCDRLAREYPGLPVLTMSGFAPDAAGNSSRWPDLAKPFRPSVVLDLLASTLSGQKSG
ncbi:MAG: PAS domain S-box protein [Gammaproteobacteria bacterium]|nr:PAS domain S-box protein [Gammaproteobacteria bacterium]